MKSKQVSPKAWLVLTGKTLVDKSQKCDGLAYVPRHDSWSSEYCDVTASPLLAPVPMELWHYGELCTFWDIVKKYKKLHIGYCIISSRKLLNVIIWKYVILCILRLTICFNVFAFQLHII